RPGEVVDAAGAVLGTHGGHHRFTVGQRKGLRLGVPAADGQPRYVLAISPVDNTVTVGPHEALAVSEITGIRPTWAVAEPRLGSWRGLVQVRAHGTPLPCGIEADAEGVRIALDEPAFGIAPGQAAVLYDGDLVVGAATIAGAR
ncbi:MAG: tRNA 2-thiouridine(34) synthase MnmA, partial [Propioniciclava sp.]|nr:tRNA 2-thiouridine(34) synthase MnmA [Propioniciclava sp.]